MSVRRNDGRSIDPDIAGYRNVEGTPVRIAKVNCDITDEKRMRDELRHSEARYRSFIELTGQLGWTTDADGKVVEDLTQLSAFTGLSTEAIKGWGWLKVLHPDDRKHTEREWKRAVSEKKPYEVEYRLRRYDGVYRDFLGRGVPVLNVDGSVREWVGICIDITERKEMEASLKRSNQELENRVRERTAELSQRATQLARLTSELTLAEQRERRRIAEILHDHLQQLMVAAKMGQEILIERTDDELKPAAESVLDLINQSIKASRALTAELSPTALRFGDLSASLNWLAQWMHENHGFEVSIRAEPGIVLAQKDLTVLLYQSTRELLLNVVKHAGVKSARVEMLRNEENRLHIAVIDQGTGFDPDTLWEKARDGSGLGLFSILERITLLGGSLEVNSAPGEGARFMLVVPVSIANKNDMERIEKSIADRQRFKTPGGKLRVLVADDHTVVRQGLSGMLGQQSDIEVVGEAADGEAAVRMARDLLPDVILMDINMPKINGMEATRIIHSEFPEIRIIGLSMYDDNDQVVAMIDAGASAFITKDKNIEFILAEVRGEVE